MATTPSSGLRYPISSDSPNIAQYFQNLATDLDQKVDLVVASPTARNALTNTYAMQTVRETSTGRIYRRNTSNNGWDYAGGTPPPIVLCSVFGGWKAGVGHAPGAYKDASGLVHLVGWATNDVAYNPNDGAAHQLITLPVGYRPAVDVLLTMGLDSDPGSVLGRIYAATGELRTLNNGAKTVPIDTVHSLENITFHPTSTGGALS